MPNRLSIPKNLRAALVALLLAASAASPALAFPWGYSPLTGSNNYLWLSRSLFSPTSFLRGTYGYSTPYYLANNLAWTAASVAGRGINAYGKKQAAKQVWSNPANGINDPAVDQIATAKWYHPPEQAAPGPILNPEIAPLPYDFKDNGFMPVPFVEGSQAAVQAETAPVPEASKQALVESQAQSQNIAGSQNSLPPKAPDFRPATNKTALPANARTEQNPFAQAFIDHVNKEFAGNLNEALADKRTRNYAEALGITCPLGKKISELGPEKLELIKRILADENEDSIAKVAAIRLLVKH